MKKLLKTLLCSLMILANVTMISAESTTTELDAVIAQVEMLNEEEYSIESFRALEHAMQDAKQLDENASQETIDAAKANLESLMAALAPRYENLALNKTVTASTSYSGAKFAVVNATDGDLTTRWGNNYNSTAFKGGNQAEWIMVDLGALYPVECVEIVWESSYATKYSVQGSTNGGDFFDLSNVTLGDGNVERHANFGSVKVRYIRLNLQKAKGKYGYSIWELRVFGGNPYATAYENVALNKEVNVSSTYEGEKWNSLYLTDGNTSTRWGSNYDAKPLPAEEYVIVDLAQEYTMDRINVTFESAYATKYDIETSLDGSTYTPLHTDLEGAKGLNVLKGMSTKARFVKLVFKEAVTKYGYSIYEIEVYEKRINTLTKAIAAFETKLASYQVGNEEGMLLEADKQAFDAVLAFAKDVANNEQALNIDINAAIIALNDAMEDIEDSIVSGEVGVSIYPKPQYMTTLSETGVRVRGNVDIVLHGEHDEATLPKLQAILAQAGITSQVVDTVGENYAIIVANKCSDAACPTCTALTDEHNVLVNKQAYLFKSDDKQVSIIGSDADGAYYGVMTLAQVLEQATNDGRIAQVLVSDYPDVEFRGYVEGFYGIPWSYQDRVELFEDTTKYKMTTYIYAPKDDPYHRDKWRDMYPADKVEEMTSLNAVAHANNMEFCWTIHPGADYNYTADSDGDGVVDDYAALIEKFEQVYSFGVRQFGIFYDDLDYDVADGNKHAQTINDAYAYLTSKYDDVKPFITVVTRYTNSWGAPWDTYFKPFMQKLHEDTIVLWTGQSTMSAITKAYMEVPKTKTGVDRDFGVWWNYPVTDYAYGHLFMGSLDCLSSDVDNINSFFLNPMSEADASKVAIYSGADYAWNTFEFESVPSWKRAIKELVPEANEAFERFADNVSYIDKGNGFFFDESKYLKDDLAAFTTAIEDGYDEGENAVLKAHFEQMVADSYALRNIKDTALLEEITPYVNSYLAIANAGVELMNAYDYALTGDINNTLTSLSTQRAYLDESSTYKIRKLNNKVEFVTVGGYRLKPFLESADDGLLRILGENIHYDIENHMITNVELLNTKDVVFEDKAYTLKDITASMKANDYVGIALSKVMDLYAIEATVDAVDKVKLQASLNGIDWNDVSVVVDGTTMKTDDITTATYVRLVALEDVDVTFSLNASPTWSQIRTQASTSLATYKTYVIGQAIDGDMSTNFWSSTGSSAGSYVQVDLGAVATLNKVELYSGINKHGVVDGFDVTILEVSKDGKVWNEVAQKALSEYVDVDSTMKKLVFDLDGAKGRYFRFVAKGASESWAKVYEVTYDVEYTDYENRVAITSSMELAAEQNVENLFDGNTTNAVVFKNAQAENDYIQIDLGEKIALYDLELLFGADQVFESTTLQISTNGKDWTNVATVNKDAYGTEGNMAKVAFNAQGALTRYFRFETASAHASDIKVHEVRYNQTVADKATIKTVSTSMKTYQSYAIGNTFDGKLDTKFYAGETIESGDYVKVDFGSITNLYDTSIYFGGDPNNAKSFDGFKKMDIKVSTDGSTWTTVKSMTSDKYIVVGGRYVANADLGGVQARYLQFVSTEASSSWLQVYEVQVNNKVNVNALRYVDDLGSVNISNSNYLDDGDFQTNGFMYEVDANDTLVYPMTTVTNVTSIGVMQASDFISNAVVSVQDAEGNWSDVGTLNETWTMIDVNSAIKAVKFTFDGNMIPMIYEILVMGLADYARVNQALALVPEDTSIYTLASVATLNEAIAAVVEGKEIIEQTTVDGYANAIHDAIRGLEEEIATVKNLKAEAINYKTIQLTWDAFDGATSYIVERLSGDEWIEVAQTSEPAYTAEGVKTGKEYTYRVKADNADYSKEVSITTTLNGEVELSIAPNGTTKFDLTWTAVDGATRYIVYRKAADSEWKKILTLGKDARTYTSKDMNANIYQYQVKAARYDSVERVQTNGSNVVEGVVGAEEMAPANVKVENVDGTVVLSWNKVASMTHYEIYRSKDGGAYRHVKTTNATTLTNTTLKAGSTYSYKIRAYVVVNGEKVYAADVETTPITME